MITFGIRKARNGKKGRGWPYKFPRGTKVIKNFEGNHLGISRLYWKDFTITAEHLDRFLLANIGRPVSKVYSEFLERCDSSIYNPKEIFFRMFHKKEEVVSRWWGGFYITNGIINYKRKRKK